MKADGLSPSTWHTLTVRISRDHADTIACFFMEHRVVEIMQDEEWALIHIKKERFEG